MIDFWVGEFRKPDDSWRTQPLTNQATSAHHVPDQERAERSDRDQAGAKQDGDRPADSRPRFRALVKKPPQATSPRFCFYSMLGARRIAIAVKH
jgi:hypothetical protein